MQKPACRPEQYIRSRCIAGLACSFAIATACNGTRQNNIPSSDTTGTGRSTVVAQQTGTITEEPAGQPQTVYYDSGIAPYTGGISRVSYIVIADSGWNAPKLYSEMLAIQRATGMQIDLRNVFVPDGHGSITPNRKTKLHLIRTWPSAGMSLEYVATYERTDRHPGKLVIVAGICERKESADSLAALLVKSGIRPWVRRYVSYQG